HEPCTEKAAAFEEAGERRGFGSSVCGRNGHFESGVSVNRVADWRAGSYWVSPRSRGRWSERGSALPLVRPIGSLSREPVGGGLPPASTGSPASRPLPWPPAGLPGR